MIKLAYLGCGLKRHSTGYLSKDLIGQHDPELFEAHFILFEGQPDDLSRDHFCKYPDRFHTCDGWAASELARLIRSLQIDILVIMDGTTRPQPIEVAARRVAPIQLSWLGGDDPGIPQIDGIFADRHLIPDHLRKYYPRVLDLPSYCAIESINVSKLVDMKEYQQKLGVPDDGFLFFSAAPGFKRSDALIEMQCRILRQTANSYLIIKGTCDQHLMIQRYGKIASPEGVMHRIRFLSTSQSEEVHRAHISVADLVLDTFPYSGSTHSVEALALGIPVLTLEQRHYFGRQSLSLLRSSGLESLIAKSPQEYFQIAQDLCEDKDLYDDISRQVLASRYTSPVFRPTKVRAVMEQHYLDLMDELDQRKSAV